MDAPDPLKEIGILLRKRRIRRGIEQQDLALRVGIAQGYLSEIEQAKKLPTLPTLLSICRALSCSMGDLICEAEELSRPVLKPQIDPFE